MAPMVYMHTYGPSCHLASSVNYSRPANDDSVPPVRPQFFYSSPLPIDDPLSAVPATTAESSAKHPPRPFSVHDSNLLEEAWLGLGSSRCQKRHRKLSGSPARHLTDEESKQVTNLVKEIAARHVQRHGAESIRQDGGSSGAIASARGSRSYSVEISTSCCSDLERDIKHDLHKIFPSLRRGKNGKTQLWRLIRDVMEEQRKQIAQASGGESDTSMEESTERQSTTDAHDEGSMIEQPDDTRGRQLRQNDVHDGIAILAANVPAGTGTTGNPFQRAPSRSSEDTSPSATQSPSPGTSQARSGGEDSDVKLGAGDTTYNDESSAEEQYDSAGHVDEDIIMEEGDGLVHVHRCKHLRRGKEEVDIPVGVARLHSVKLPSLQMMPIYWSPVHDIASVIRGTWFYSDSMYPVEPAVANQLEMGYRELRPWSRTWKDELSSALSIGPEAEEKVVHKLWPTGDDENTSAAWKTGMAAPPQNSFCAAKCFNGEVAAEGTIEVVAPGEKHKDGNAIVRRYPNSHVVYKDATQAYILKPSLAPSSYYGRRPVAKIMRGLTVGIHVVRGFDWQKWDKIHPSTRSALAARVEKNAPASEVETAKKNLCAACEAKETHLSVSDLVLVIHGIGQKLSERVESFHFTHAINAFRRSVNVELENKQVQSVLQDNLGGIMVLPINWRANLSLEEGGSKGDNSDISDGSDFTLKDITPKTIPTVRNLLSDVLLDVPFYMSHHKPKMIEAVVYEANRVYGLWCQNNPKFHEEGRVHIIAHSLGSAMALDILTQQPTIPPHIDLKHKSRKINTKHFDFDTKNLFFAGSPAGFFLLLHRGKLVPRRGRHKPGAEGSDDETLTGEIGQFGCLAVDNLYNIMHQHDPISYRLNAVVDTTYAKSIKDAVVPSATTGWLSSISNTMRSIIPGATAAPELGVGQVAPKPPNIARLPSQLEMEVHDFTKEEMAEKKMLLLNDNGQIDWFLSSGGGPLEIQYLNMLSAHSSYWYSADFVRLLVTEIGRRPGKEGVLPNMRATKKAVKVKK